MQEKTQKRNNFSIWFAVAVAASLSIIIASVTKVGHQYVIDNMDKEVCTAEELQGDFDCEAPDNEIPTAVPVSSVTSSPEITPELMTISHEAIYYGDKCPFGWGNISYCYTPVLGDIFFYVGQQPYFVYGEDLAKLNVEPVETESPTTVYINNRTDKN